jgi:hypothetical protein
MRWLEQLERRTSRWPLLRHLGDHFLVVLQKD